MLTDCQDSLPNPHRDCVRSILSSLICYENDLRVINFKIREIQAEYKKEVDAIECRCSDLRAPVCDSTDKVVEFRTHIAAVEEVKRCYQMKIDNLQQRHKDVVSAAKRCMAELQNAKCKLKHFHEKTVDYLQRLAINTEDLLVVRNCERDICEMEKLLEKELIFIKKSENQLESFFQRIMGDEHESYRNCCCFKDFKWLPKGKGIQVVGEITCEMKTLMGTTLRRAFADIAVHQPADPQYYLAAYLLNVDRSEKLMKEKLKVFGDATLNADVQN